MNLSDATRELTGAQIMDLAPDAFATLAMLEDHFTNVTDFRSAMLAKNEFLKFRNRVTEMAGEIDTQFPTLKKRDEGMGERE